MQNKELKLVGVNKKYKLEGKQTFQALFDVNVEFEKGELVSIVGESGSGKSTLMNLIGGLDSDFSGDIIVGEENLRTLTDKQLDKYRKNKVGFVFQSFNLISHLSILDNVTLALTLSNVSEKEKVKKATKMLERVGLSNQLKKKPTQLSGGQKQRVAIARALINDPEIIIADEPTGALDSTTSMQILQLLKEIADSGKLVIMVTHSEKVASVSSRVVEISDGRIIADRVNVKYKKTKSLDASTNQTETANAVTDAEPVAHEKVAENTFANREDVADETSTANALSSAQCKKHKTGKNKNFKDRQNLSMWSAIRLSMHNMMASKTKNILMSIGVAIGIGSLILMMCFSSGITDFIDDTMKSYSDPTIVTVSKKSDSKDMSSMFAYNSFSQDEISNLITEINADLKKKNVEFEVTQDNISYGIQMMTLTMGAKVIFKIDDTYPVNYFANNGKDLAIAKEEGKLNYDSIFYMYTIPPYYSDSNVLQGEMSTNKKGVMFSKGILDLFEDHSIFNEDGSSKTVDICLTYTNPTTGSSNLTFSNQEITGIMDTSVMSNFLVMYVDYDYFQTLFSSQQETGGKELDPNSLYIKTPSEAVTNAINQYLASTSAYTGSIEDQLAGMFDNMSSTIGTSLIVISCISLLVSAMMILVVLYMSVSERTKEIGVLKSIGARRKDIKRIFSSESFLIGVLSGVCGIIFNLLLTLVIYLVLKTTIGLAPISYRWWYFVVAMAISICISMLSGLYPASKAAKLDPVESLRRE